MRVPRINKAPLLFQGGVRGGKLDNMKESIHNLKALENNRKQLRNNLTPAEAALWKMLQNSQLEGRKFRRQHSVGNYILDFYCPSERLCIELDGAYHFTEQGASYDQERTHFLNRHNIRVIRFENKDVFEQTDYVLQTIGECFKKK